jgi:anthranilate synthase component 1
LALEALPEPSVSPPQPSLEEVKTLLEQQKGNCVPIYTSLPADLLTPVIAYLKIAEKSRYSFLLESILGGENLARYSFIGSGEFLARLRGRKPL